MIDTVLGHRHDDEIREERAVRVQIPGRDRMILVRPDDEDATLGCDRRQRSAAAVEHDQVGTELLRDPRAREDVRDPDRPGEPTAAAPAADGRQPGQGSRLEVVGRRVAPGAGKLEEIGHGWLDLDHLGLGRPPTPHRDDDDAPVAGHHPRDMPRDGRLADALAGADHGHGRRPDRLEARRLEPEVGALVRHAERQRASGEPESCRRAEHGLVGEIEHHVGRVLARSPPRATPASGTPYSSPPRSFSVPPTKTHATISCGSSTRASLTTEA